MARIVNPKYKSISFDDVKKRYYVTLYYGVDQFGGNNSKGPIVEAYRMGSEKYGEAFMKNRMEASVRRLLTNILRIGLYLDPEESKKIVGLEEGLEAQHKPVVLLKNKKKVLPLDKGIKVYILERKIAARKNFFRMMKEEKTIIPVSREMAEGYFELVNDLVVAEVAMVFVESPLSESYIEGKGYQP